MEIDLEKISLKQKNNIKRFLSEDPQFQYIPKLVGGDRKPNSKSSYILTIVFSVAISFVFQINQINIILQILLSSLICILALELGWFLQKDLVQRELGFKLGSYLSPLYYIQVKSSQIDVVTLINCEIETPMSFGLSSKLQKIHIISKDQRYTMSIEDSLETRQKLSFILSVKKAIKMSLYRNEEMVAQKYNILNIGKRLAENENILVMPTYFSFLYTLRLALALTASLLFTVFFYKQNEQPKLTTSTDYASSIETKDVKTDNDDKNSEKKSYSKSSNEKSPSKVNEKTTKTILEEKKESSPTSLPIKPIVSSSKKTLECDRDGKIYNDKSYEYKYVNGVWYTRKTRSKKWIGLKNDQMAIAAIEYNFPCNGEKGAVP